MKISFLSRILYTVSICLLFACTKEYSGEGKGGGNSSALFNIAITETDCAAITLQGQYLENMPLTSNETMRVEVDVLQAGQWSFSTLTLNGFYFSGSGNFEKTGKQTLVLNGAGTPLSPGNYRFRLTDTSSASFLISVLKHDVVEEAVGSTSYFKVTIDGVEYNYMAEIPGPDGIPYGFSPGSGDSASFSSFMGSNAYPRVPGQGTISLQKNFITNYSGSSEADFKNFFAPGACPFVCPGSCNFSYNTPGILIFWVGEDGEVWATRQGSANQEGSSFTIVGIEDGHNLAGNYFVKVKTRFNCTLYDREGGNSIALTDGEMVSYFIRPL
jgi:hypothetical protein